jgi:hypothetical protein
MKNLLKTLRNAEVCCIPCGNKYGEPRGLESSVWIGRCNICGEEKPVTETRDFRYLAKGIRELDTKRHQRIVP